MKSQANNNLNKTIDMISTLIHEYLYKKEYNKTLDSFQEELAEKIKAGKFYSSTYKDISDTSLISSIVSLLLAAFIAACKVT